LAKQKKLKPFLSFKLIMNMEREFNLLKDAFIDFMNKILPALEDPTKELIRERWHPFKEMIQHSGKSNLDIYLYVTRLTYLTKESKLGFHADSRIKTTESDKKPHNLTIGSSNSPI
jgi:hypothetical protein